MHVGFWLLSFEILPHIGEQAAFCYILSSTLNGFEADEELICIVSQAKGNEHEFILWLPDAGKWGFFFFSSRRQ